MKLLYRLFKFSLILIWVWPLYVFAFDDPFQDKPSDAKDLPCLSDQHCFTDPAGDTWCKKEADVETAKSFRDCPYCPEMVRLPSGLSIGKYEVTQAQWRAVMGSNPSYHAGCDSCPVEMVNWDNAQNYIKRLNRITGKHYRLPTEREWYDACRSGSYHTYCGSNDVDEVAWYMANAADHTHPVGGKSPNAYGLYDMSGNIWEWTSGCCNSECSCRIFRGGSLAMEPSGMKSNAREGFGAAVSFRAVGFRLVRN
jgi:formylglycine-generating enzyme required for sulfatase activity